MHSMLSSALSDPDHHKPSTLKVAGLRVLGDPFKGIFRAQQGKKWGVDGFCGFRLCSKAAKLHAALEAAGSPSPQRTQNRLIKEYTLSPNIKAPMIQGIFLNSGIWGSLGLFKPWRAVPVHFHVGS